ncbi:hypothetical protein AAFG13_42605 [Bradyrhizobium sp. B124]|uniref:hypothetical protein n=1 Tax=Bradyrhizobium sp. B124 TaxID=3140245 RepID=UPI0031843A31
MHEKVPSICGDLVALNGGGLGVELSQVRRELAGDSGEISSSFREMGSGVI